MRASSHFGGGSKPLQITTYTSGSGNYTPLAANSLLRVTIQAPGGGGGRAPLGTASPGGGGAGAELQFWVRATGAQPYVVGAVGVGATANNTSGTDGGSSSFGFVAVPGGKGGLNNGTSGEGGFVGSLSAAIANCYPGGAGGPGRSAANVGFAGSAPGFPVSGAVNVVGLAPQSNGGAAGAGAGGGGGGGYSKNGRGSTGGAGGGATGSAAPSDGTGYGGGGGGGGGGTGTSGNGSNGLGGFITVEDFGA